MRQKRSLLRSTLLLTLASMSLRCSALYFQAFLASSIGAAGVGLLQLVSSVGFFAMTLGTSGIRVGAMYLCAEEYGHQRPGGVCQAVHCSITYGLVFSVLVGTGLILFAESLSRRWLGDPQAAGCLRLFGLFLPVSCLWTILDGYFTACSKIRQFVAVEFLDRCVSIAFTLLLLLFWAGDSVGRSCSSVILGNCLGTLTGTGILFFLYNRDRRKVPPVRSGNGTMMRKLFRLCLPLAFSDYLRSGLSTLEQFLIPWGLTKSGAGHTASMAVYGTIHGMVFPVLMFPSVVFSSLSDLLVPELAICQAKNDTRRIHLLTRRCLKLGFLFSAAIACLLFCLAMPLGRLLYRSPQAGFYLRLFSPMVLILYMDAMTDGMLKGLGQQVYCVRYNTLTSFLDVPSLFFLLPAIGIPGYLITFAVSHVLNFVLSLRRLITVTRYTLQPQFPCKVLFCSGLCCCFCFKLSRFLSSDLAAVVLFPVLFSLSFFLVLQLFSVLEPEELRWLQVRFRRPASAPVFSPASPSSAKGVSCDHV